MVSFSQSTQDGIYGEYELISIGSPFNRAFISIDGTFYLYQDKVENPASYTYYFIDNLMFIGKLGYYYSFKTVDGVPTLTLLPAFGEEIYPEVTLIKIQ